MRDGSARRRGGRLAQFIREVADEGSDSETPERELLVRFAVERDGSAFRALVCRHGPMVFRVCLRVLRCESDAQDAFQATFLVLAHRAATVQKSDSVGSWLFGVARRVSMKMRTAAARRRSREREAVCPKPVDPLAELTVREAQEVLDSELVALPGKYRAPIVLCCLEGLTRDEAAKQLGWELGRLKSRLAQARELLRVRLVRRGLTIPAALLAGLLGSVSAAKAVPVELLDAVTRTAVEGGAATTLSATAVAAAEEVVRAMTLSKIRIAVTVLVAAGVLASEPIAHVPPDVPVPVEKLNAKASPLAEAPAPGVPADRWSVEFANAVTQVCEMREDGTASVVELALPKYSGKVIDNDGPVLVEYTGARTQRFTPVGERMVVEYWPPGARKAGGRPVLGIAERVPKGSPGKLRHTDAARGFRLSVPADWAVVPASYPAHYRTAFLCINSRGDRRSACKGRGRSRCTAQCASRSSRAPSKTPAGGSNRGPCTSTSATSSSALTPESSSIPSGPIWRTS